ncbi:MAG: FlgT C-terminal domain-containing protein [Schleiferilactobacillus perolens]|uniref:FlgT C-terminal domain-containing protein n=1 Tax=Schleiferilactobacillus perolens TaxID=100468 RepID=UPI0039EC5FB4
MKQIECHVIQILSERAILIDAGKKDGVDRGDVVTIVERGDAIMDSTGKMIGHYDFVKAQLTITRVEFSFSEVQSLKRRSSAYFIAVGQLSQAMSNNFHSRIDYSDPEPINVDSSDIHPLRHDVLSDRKVRVGDLVKIDVD